MNNVWFVYCWRHERILKWIFSSHSGLLRSAFCSVDYFIFFFSFTLSTLRSNECCMVFIQIPHCHTIKIHTRHNGIEPGLSCQFLCYIITEFVYEVNISRVDFIKRSTNADANVNRILKWLKSRAYHENIFEIFICEMNELALFRIWNREEL